MDSKFNQRDVALYKPGMSKGLVLPEHLQKLPGGGGVGNYLNPKHGFLFQNPCVAIL